jgi:hypothetical protein
MPWGYDSVKCGSGVIVERVEEEFGLCVDCETDCN